MIFRHNGIFYLECNNCGAVAEVSISVSQTAAYDSIQNEAAAGRLRAKARKIGWYYADVERGLTRDWCAGCQAVRDARHTQ